MSEPIPVTIKMVGDSFVVEPDWVPVNRSQTLISFKLQIHGLSFAPTEAIVVDPRFKCSFLSSWTENPPENATLLDLNNKFGPIDYQVMVVNTAGGTPFPLGFQKTPQIENKPV